MPIRLSKKNPAFEILRAKKIFLIDKKRADEQEIRPLRIGILNLMPTKRETEAQIFRMIGSSPLQIEPILIRTKSYEPKNISASHLENFYVFFDDAKKDGLDGLIVTGAPVEKLEFSAVKYWRELTEIFDFAAKKICSTLFLCWAAQAAAFYFYGIKKFLCEKKIFGVFSHTHTGKCDFLLRGLDDNFFVPHSRATEMRKKDLQKISALEILSESRGAGIHLFANKNRSQVFVTGHPEYDRDTLAREFFRDREKNLPIKIPQNYFPKNDPQKIPKLNWRANSETFYRNWINFVYQHTNFDPRKFRM